MEKLGHQVCVKVLLWRTHVCWSVAGVSTKMAPTGWRVKMSSAEDKTKPPPPPKNPVLTTGFGREPEKSKMVPPCPILETIPTAGPSGCCFTMNECVLLSSSLVLLCWVLGWVCLPQESPKRHFSVCYSPLGLADACPIGFWSQMFREIISQGRFLKVGLRTSQVKVLSCWVASPLLLGEKLPVCVCPPDCGWSRWGRG